MDDLSYLRTYGCQAAGCTDPAWADRDMHAPNCTQGEFDLALDEIERLRALARAVCENPSESLDWEAVRCSDLDALRAALGIAVG